MPLLTALEYSPPARSGSASARASLAGLYEGNWCCTANKRTPRHPGCWGQESPRVTWPAATPHRHHPHVAEGDETTPHVPSAPGIPGNLCDTAGT